MGSIGPFELILLTLVIVPAVILIRKYIRRNKKTVTSRIIDKSIPAVKKKSPKPQKINREKIEPAIFISYRRGSASQVTGRIYDRLVQEYGKGAVFKDVDSIPPGVDFRKHLNDAVQHSNIFLAVIGKDWSERLKESRDFVRIEIEAALQRGKIVLPLFLDEINLPREEELPATIHRLLDWNGLKIRPDPDFHNDINRLISAINQHLTQFNEQN